MDPATPFLKLIDPILIAPYRLFENPMLGWWTGTMVLVIWVVLVGELTLAIVSRINRKPISESWDKTLYYHEQSFKAKQAGDEKAYQGINKLANEAYGKSFFLSIAMGMASLWPAFFAAAWLKLRFGSIVFALPSWAGGVEFNYLAPFVMLFIAVRIAVPKMKRFLPTLRSSPAA